MSDQITRVARAIAERALISSRHPWPAPDHPDWLDLACAAIDAMTSPNDQPVVEPAEIERLRALLDAAYDIERQRMAVAMTEMSLRAQRRDYIATACLSAIIVRQDCSGSVDDCARDAIRYADALIVQFDKEAILARLDKEAKP